VTVRQEEALAETLEGAASNLKDSLAELRQKKNKEPRATVEAVARKLEEFENEAKLHRERAAEARRKSIDGGKTRAINWLRLAHFALLDSVPAAGLRGVWR
jgi:hypothetical protein